MILTIVSCFALDTKMHLLETCTPDIQVRYRKRYQKDFALQRIYWPATQCWLPNTP